MLKEIHKVNFVKKTKIRKKTFFYVYNACSFWLLSNTEYVFVFRYGDCPAFQSIHQLVDLGGSIKQTC